MGFDLEIIFQGMCTFVPDPDNGKLWVLMRDSVMPQSILRRRVPAHAAFIRFPLANLVPETPGFGLRRLNHLDIRIAGQGEEGMKYQDFEVENDQPTANPGFHSFAWVSPLEEACAQRDLAGGGVIDPRFLKPLDKLAIQDANRMAARFAFTEGTVSTQMLAGINGELLDSAFHPPTPGSELDNDLSQPTAAMVSVTTFIEADAVTFESTTLQNNRAVPPLTLKPVGPENKLTINVLNEEADTLVRLPAPPIHFGKARPQDLIFLSMFEFCANPPQLSNRPMPIPKNVSTRFPSPPSGIILGGSPPCSPARASARQKK
jgi:hypothetical protein